MHCISTKLGQQRSRSFWGSPSRLWVSSDFGSPGSKTWLWAPCRARVNTRRAVQWVVLLGGQGWNGVETQVDEERAEGIQAAGGRARRSPWSRRDSLRKGAEQCRHRLRREMRMRLCLSRDGVLSPQVKEVGNRLRPGARGLWGRPELMRKCFLSNSLAKQSTGQ